MEETGTVTEIKDINTAIVRMSKAGGCEGCKASGSCKAVSDDRVLEADNRIGAKVGQNVMLVIESGAFLKASFIVYMVPIIFLFIGAALGGNFGPAVYPGITVDFWQAIGGVMFLALSIGAIRLYDNMIHDTKRFRPVITKIMDDGDCGQCG